MFSSLMEKWHFEYKVTNKLFRIVFIYTLYIFISHTTASMLDKHGIFILNEVQSNKAHLLARNAHYVGLMYLSNSCTYLLHERFLIAEGHF